MKVVSLLNGYKLKDAQARKNIEDVRTELYANLVPTNKLHWLEGTATLTTGSNQKAEIVIPAPDGVDLEDCIVIGAMTKGLRVDEWRTVYDKIPVYDGGNEMSSGDLPLNPTVVLTSVGTIKLQFSMEYNNTAEVSYKILLYDRSRG